MKFCSPSWILTGLWAVASFTTEAATHVAVLEFGTTKNGGSSSVRRTDAPPESEYTNADGVASFWNALHRGRRLQQRAGMPLVPDLFKRPDAGVVLALSGRGIDLDQLPVLSGLLESDSSNNAVVGRLQVDGQQCHNLVSKVDRVETVEADVSSIQKACHQAASEPRNFAAVQVASLDAASAQTVDRDMTSLLQDLHDLAESTGKTVVLHLVVEEDEGAARRRSRSLLEASSSSSAASVVASRRLEEERDGEQNNNQQQGDGEGNNNNGQEQQQQYNGYYGYGYYNNYGEYVTPYKTMFQIQYFNVVLWTALGLVFSLFFVIYLMVYMPLEPDTLLFGESAKMVGSE